MSTVRDTLAGHKVSREGAALSSGICRGRRIEVTVCSCSGIYPDFIDQEQCVHFKFT